MKRCPCLIEARASLAITNCRLGRVSKGRGRLLGQSLVIRFLGSEFVIENSELYAPSSVLLMIGSEGATHQSVSVRNNAVTAAFAFKCSSGGTLEERQVEMVENNVLGGAFFSIDDTKDVRMRVSAEGNVLDVDTVLGGNMHWNKFVSRLSSIEWVGREILFACQFYLISFWSKQPAEAYLMNEIEEWQALAAIDEELAVDEERAIASD